MNPFDNFPSPITASVAITTGCNSRCLYCGAWEKTFTHTHAAALFEVLEQLAGMDVKLVSFTGGEPFQHPELALITQKADQLGLIVSIVTNGILLNSNRLESIFQVGLNSLVISLDTLSPETYRAIRGTSIRPVLKGIENAVAMRDAYPSVKLSISCVLSKANLHQIDAVVEFCHKYDLFLGFQPLHPAFREGREEISTLAVNADDLPSLHSLIEHLIQWKENCDLILNSSEYLRAFPDYMVYRKLPLGFVCHAGDETVTIDAELNVRSCWGMKPLGNLAQETLSNLWISPLYEKRRRKMRALDCKLCWLRCHTENRSRDLLDEMFKQ